MERRATPLVAPQARENRRAPPRHPAIFFLMRARSLCRCAVAVLAVAFFCGGAVAQTAQVDHPAPELDIRLLNGKLLKAKDLRGKVVVNVLWATWSPDARIEMPVLERAYREHRDKGLEIVALSIDESVADVRDFWRKREYSFPAAMRSDAFFDHYGRVSTTPTFYIVDRHGVLRHRIAGAVEREKFEALLRPLLAEPPPASVAKK
jgi:thiol-disulfide isomerase/thioredoxin